jgi:large subunit ribosomal protein L9
MQVILKEDVANLGKMGEVVTVKDGYGRNFLIPQHKAALATKGNLAQIEHQKRVIAKTLSKLQAAAKGQLEKLEAITATVRKPVGEGEKLFGSVTARDIEQAVHEEGIKDLDRKTIQLAEPIKTLGVYKIQIKLAPSVYAKLSLWVLPE